MAGNWRGGSNSHPQRKSSAPTAPQVKLAPIGWRRHSGREVAKASNRVWLRRFAGIFAVVVLAGLLVALYLLLNPVRPQLVVDVGRYGSEMVIPGGSVGMSVEELADALPNLTVTALQSSDGEVFSRRSDASIVFVDSMILSGANGPFIADDQSRPDDTNLRTQPLAGSDNRPKSATQWLAPVLERARSRPTLLVLDLSQPRVNWRSGVLAPYAAFEFLEELQREVARQTKEAPDTRLAVLVACRPGEQAWSEGGRSRFSRSVIEALRGAADGARTGKTDGRVSAAELGHYVCDDVQTWVAAHRFAGGQHPVWMMLGPDFDIAYTAEGSANWPAAPTGGGEVLDALEEAWRRRDALWSGEEATLAYRDAPLDWRRVNHLLLHAEAHYRAGQLPDAKSLLADAKTSFNRLKSAERPLFDPPTAASAQLASFQDALPASITAAELQESVDVRSAVHQAATRSPRAIGIIRQILLEADAARHEAEDALFLGNLETVRSRRGEAAQQYQRCLDAAERYDRACGALDRMLAGLPHLADWAAMQQISDRVLDAFAVTPSEIGDVELQSQGIDLVASLLVEARSIRQAISELEQSTAPLEEVSQQIAAVAGRAEVAVQQMTDLEATLRKGASDLLSSEEGTGGRRLIRRRQLEESLSNVLLDGTTRRRILEELARLDDGLDVSVVATSEDATARESQGLKNFAWQPGTVSQELAKLAAWQGVWALLVRSLDPLADSESDRLWKDNWAVLAGQARLDEAQRPFDAETARKTASSLGDLLRIGWKASAAETSRSRSYSGDVNKITRELVQGDRIARCLPGFDADTLIRSRPRNPAVDLAAWNDAQLSLFLAKQSLEDFYANRTGGTHWFDEAGRFYLDSANSTVRGVSAISNAVTSDVTATQELLSHRRASRFWVQADRVTFGSYDKRPALLNVSMEGAPPPGSAAVWLDTLTSNPAVQLASPDRQVVPVDAANSGEETLVSIDLLRNVPSCDLVSLPARVFYRGHANSDSRTLEVDPCPPGRRVAVAMPQPERGTVIVSGTDRRSILFVLDCSKSMLEPLPNGNSKMFEAKNILQQTVGNLQEAAGANSRRIGLVAFGHRMNRRANGQLWPNENWRANQMPADPLLDYETLVPLEGAAGADPALFGEQLARLEGWGMTPLVNSIRFALKEFPAGEPGTLVVITDGADSALDKGNAALIARTQAVLKEVSKQLADRRAKGSAIEVQMVGFAVNAVDKKLLQEVFDAVATPGVEGPFAANGANLKAFLQNAVEPRQYSVVAAGRNDGLGFDLGVESEALARGEYRLSFPDTTPASLTISGGERIVFDLRDAKLVPRKYQWGSAAGLIARATDAPSGPDTPDVLVDRGYRIDAGQATVLVSLDRAAADSNPPRTTTEGFVERPQEVWFEATDASGRRVTALSWEIAEQYDIPTWKLSLPAPSDQKLNITAHWKMSATVPHVGTILSREDIGKDVTASTPAGSASLVLKSFGKDDQRPGIVVARFEPLDGKPPADDVRALLENTWAQIDPGPPGSGEFRPIEAQTERTFFFDEGAIEFAFSTGSDFDATTARIGLMTPDAREKGAAVATLRYPKAD